MFSLIAGVYLLYQAYRSWKRQEGPRAGLYNSVVYTTGAVVSFVAAGYFLTR